MDRLCTILDKLVECFTCASQTLPPFKLCLDAHMVCTPCFKYLPHCSCGQQFADGPHSAIDWMASAMKLRCKYRDGGGFGTGKRRGRRRPAEDACQTRWFAMQDLDGHYRDECTRNAFQCPVDGCGHADRIDTVVEHYEGDAHGPIEELEPDDPDWPYQITFQILAGESKVIRKLFNGYFLIAVKPRRSCRQWDPNVRLSIENINPNDKLQYTKKASAAVLNPDDIDVTVTISDAFEET